MASSAVSRCFFPAGLSPAKLRKENQNMTREQNIYRGFGENMVSFNQGPLLLKRNNNMFRKMPIKAACFTKKLPLFLLFKKIKTGSEYISNGSATPLLYWNCRL
ncbi:hypothetical protein ACFL5V_07345, partial [Fibrobacterota bacterium]